MAVLFASGNVMKRSQLLFVCSTIDDVKMFVCATTSVVVLVTQLCVLLSKRSRSRRSSDPNAGQKRQQWTASSRPVVITGIECSDDIEEVEKVCRRMNGSGCRRWEMASVSGLRLPLASCRAVKANRCAAWLSQGPKTSVVN